MPGGVARTGCIVRFRTGLAADKASGRCNNVISPGTCGNFEWMPEITVFRPLPVSHPTAVLDDFWRSVRGLPDPSRFFTATSNWPNDETESYFSFFCFLEKSGEKSRALFSRKERPKRAERSFHEKSGRKERSALFTKRPAEKTGRKERSALFTKRAAETRDS